MSLTLVLPFGTKTRDAVEPKARRAARKPLKPLPSQPVLGLIENGKVKADKLLGLIAESLKARGAIANYFVHKKTPSATITEADRDAIVARADLVLSGLGDCGGCTACSTTDALMCLEQGVPAFMLATVKFEFLVEAADREYGITGLNRLFVDHPVWSRDDAWFAAAADRLADQMLAGLGRETSAVPLAPAARSIDDALAELRSGMDADGYDMEVRLVDGLLKIDVIRRPGAGELCLMPQPAFANLVASMLQGAGIAQPADRIDIRYPASAA